MALVPVHIFVYGTLKPGEVAYDQLCRPHVLEAHAAIVPGRLYHLPQGYPALTTEPGWVQGYCLALADLSILARLDEFEDYDPKRPEASLYHRVLEPVFRPDGSLLKTAWLYRMDLALVNRFQGRWLPQGDWSSGCCH